VNTRVWREVAEDVFVRSYVEQALNVGLVVGAERCLVIDTRSSEVQGAELVTAVRGVTTAPWVGVNTHAHWDHCFGNARFLPSDIWGHERCVTMLERYGELQRDLVAAQATRDGEAGFAAEVAAVGITPPNRTFEATTEVDLGGRTVHLHHLGLGHTDNDVVIHVPDAGVLFAGDLVEEGAPPAFDDSFPLDWAPTLERLLELRPDPVVPGHGEVVGVDHVRQQAATIARTAAVARAAYAAGRDPADVVGEVPLPEWAAFPALRRAYRQLADAPPYDAPEQVRAEVGLTP
jgi:glyoxylase-like metal-dependent hydrolase (beta-lactamase superfamily II)